MAPADEEFPVLRALAAKLAEIARLTQLGDDLLASRASRGASEAYGAALLLAPDDDELVAKKALADRMVAAAQLKEEGAALMTEGLFKEAAAKLYKSATLDPARHFIQIAS